MYFHGFISISSFESMSLPVVSVASVDSVVDGRDKFHSLARTFDNRVESPSRPGSITAGR
jgi:hypothetical protein